MSEVLKHKILKFVTRRDYSPLKLAPLAKALGVESSQYDLFRAAFNELQESGRVVIGTKSLISLPSPSGKIVGKYRANAKGFGFVTPLELNAHGDLFIPPGQSMEAMTGDTVLARVITKDKRTGQMKFSGEIVSILERGHNTIVGTLQNEKGSWFVKPDGNTMTQPVCVDDVTAKNANVNDKVVIEIISYPTQKYLARGVIIEVLGKAGHYDAEIRSIIKQFDLPGEFDEKCLSQARLVSTPTTSAHATI